MKDLWFIYAAENRRRMVTVAGLLIALLAVVAWWATHQISLGFLYLFPIIILGGFLSRTQIIGVGVAPGGNHRRSVGGLAQS
jgi:hypothetical protein